MNPRATGTAKALRKPRRQSDPSERSRGPLRSPPTPEALSLPVPNELVEALAERVALLLASHDDDGYLDVEGASAFLACPRSRIYALVSKRAIPFEKDGSRLLFDRHELRAWVQRGGATR